MSKRKTSTRNQGALRTIGMDSSSPGGSLPAMGPTTGRSPLLPSIALFLVIALFSLLSPPFLGYGYAYLQYLPPFAQVGIPFILFALMLAVRPRWLESINAWLSRHHTLFCSVAMLLGGIAFWCLRTRIHVFMGDGAASPVPNELRVGFGRLDNAVRALLGYFALRVVRLEDLAVLPSVFAQQVYSITFGVLTIYTLLRAFRAHPLQALAFLSMPWVFNFFGNVDSYAFSVWYAICFAIFCGKILARQEPPRLGHIGLICAMWAIGLWVHPFHLFFGYLVAIAACRFVQSRWWPGCPTSAAVLLYGVALLVFIKTSRYGSNLLTTNDAFIPPALSWQTAAHYLNNIFLPLLPLGFITCLQGRTEARFRAHVMAIMALSSAIFFVMAFTLGACDQFNYHHLMAVLACYFIVFARLAPLPPRACFCLLAVHGLVLIPMIAVHSTSLTIKRARDVYPLDKSHHNCVMSWQTHLGIVLGDNIQHDPLLAASVLDVFLDGARTARPESFRFGNYVYYVAWHYNYGRLEQGRKLLSDLLRRYPQAVRFFFSDRPAFIYHNRDALWNDVLRFYPAQNDEERNMLADGLRQVREKARATPYFVRPSEYELTRAQSAPADAPPRAAGP